MSMKNQALSAAVAVAALAVAGSGAGAIADPEAADTDMLDIQPIVEPIAVLQVIESSSKVLVADHNAGASQLSELGHIQLSTNFCVNAVQLDFPRVAGVRGFESDHYGRAEGIGTGHTLGVNPYAAVGDHVVAHGSLAEVLSGGASDPMRGGADRPLVLTPGSGMEFCAEPGGLGIFDISLGLVSKWDLTLPTEPLFAAPDTYRIPITVTIVP